MNGKASKAVKLLIEEKENQLQAFVEYHAETLEQYHKLLKEISELQSSQITIILNEIKDLPPRDGLFKK